MHFDRIFLNFTEFYKMRRIHLAPIFFSVEFLNTAPPRAARVYSCSCYAAGTAAVSVLWLPAISDHMDATVPH
jgi:hypothetical protein